MFLTPTWPASRLPLGCLDGPGGDQDTWNVATGIVIDVDRCEALPTLELEPRTVIPWSEEATKKAMTPPPPGFESTGAGPSRLDDLLLRPRWAASPLDSPPMDFAALAPTRYTPSPAERELLDRAAPRITWGAFAHEQATEATRADPRCAEARRWLLHLAGAVPWAFLVAEVVGLGQAVTGLADDADGLDVLAELVRQGRGRGRPPGSPSEPRLLSFVRFVGRIALTDPRLEPSLVYDKVARGQPVRALNQERNRLDARPFSEWHRPLAIPGRSRAPLPDLFQRVSGPTRVWLLLAPNRLDVPREHLDVRPAALDAAGIAPQWRTPAADRRASEALAGVASALLREWSAARSTMRALKILEGDGSRAFESTVDARKRAMEASSRR